MFAIISRAFSIASLLVIHASYVSALKAGTTVHFHPLHLDAIESVTFAFYIIFVFLTWVQVLGAVGGLRKRKADDDFSRRRPFSLLIFLGILALFAMYVLGAILVSQTKEVTLPSVNLAVFEAMASFVQALTHMFLCVALLLLLDYRNGDSKSRNFVIGFRVVSAVLLLIMFVSALARAIIGSTRSMSYSNGQQPPLAERAYVGLYHLFLACYLLITAVICGLSVVLWMTRELLDAQPNDWLLFDANVTTFFSLINLSISNLPPGPRPHCKSHLPTSCHPCCL